MAINHEDFIFDYRLGYVRAGCSMPGFDVIGDDGAPRILTLGGYTTPELARRGRSWANFLYDAFKADGKYAQIINGDTEGYSSAQEMLMLMRDGILLKPELVICLSGFHNFAYKLGFLKEGQREYADILRKHPFTNPRQLEFFKEITSRFGLGNDEMHYGDVNEVYAWEYWLGHVDIMRCLCEEFRIRYITFLQPCVFSGSYKLSGDEAAALKEEYGLSEAEAEKFREGFRVMYEAAAKGAKIRGYITDLSGLFDEDSGAYQDACRLKDKYTAKLAGAVYKEAERCMKGCGGMTV